MAFKKSVALLAVVGSAIFCIDADRTSGPMPYAEFIAGCSLLRTAPAAREVNRQTVYFRELGKITGLTTDEVLAFLEGIRENPEKGKELYDTMQKAFAAETDSIKSKL